MMIPAFVASSWSDEIGWGKSGGEIEIGESSGLFDGEVSNFGNIVSTVMDGETGGQGDKQFIVDADAGG